MSFPHLRRLPSLGTDNTIIPNNKNSPIDDRPSSPSISSDNTPYTYKSTILEHQCNKSQIPSITDKHFYNRPIELHQEHMQINLDIWVKRIQINKRLPDRPLESYKKEIELNLNKICFKRIKTEQYNPIKIRKRLPNRSLEMSMK